MNLNNMNLDVYGRVDIYGSLGRFLDAEHFDMIKDDFARELKYEKEGILIDCKLLNQTYSIELKYNGKKVAEFQSFIIKEEFEKDFKEIKEFVNENLHEKRYLDESFKRIYKSCNSKKL